MNAYNDRSVIQWLHVLEHQVFTIMKLYLSLQNYLIHSNGKPFQDHFKHHNFRSWHVFHTWSMARVRGW